MTAETTDTQPEPKQSAYWRLTPSEVDATRAKLAKINDRAIRRGFTGRLKLDAEPCEWLETMPDGSQQRRRAFDVRVTGDAPCAAGWTFAAAIVVTYSQNDAPIVVVNAVPGSGVVVRNTDVRPGECDHCHTRRQRAKLYVVSDAEGETLQVGSTCLKDFLGWDALPVVLTESAVRDQLGACDTGATGWAVEDVLAWAWADVERRGFRPTALPDSTRDAVSTALVDFGTRGEETRRDLRDLMPEAERMVPEVQRVISEAFADAESGYEANLLALTRPGGVVEWKTLGLAVSAISAHARIIERRLKDQIERERRATAIESSRWLGEVGGKVTVGGTVTRRDYYASDYYGRPGSYLIVMHTEGGSEVSTFTSAAWADDVAVGDAVTIIGTVKSHGTFRDIKQTKLTRTKRQP